MPRAFLTPVSETEVLLQPAESVVVEEHHLAITTSTAVQRTEERDGREQKQLVACNQTHQLAQLVKREQPVRVGSKQAHGLFAEGAGTVLPRPGVDGLLQLREKVAPIQRARAAEVECRNRERAPAWNRLRRLESPPHLFFRELVHLIAWRPLMRILPPYGQPELPHTPIHARPAPLMPFSRHTA